MARKPKRAFSTRLPAEHADLLEAAIDETDTNPSEILRRAAAYYLEENPDRLVALYPDDSIERWIATLDE